MRGETRRKARRCIHRRSIAARIAAKTTGAAAHGAGERPRPRAPRRTPEGAKRGLLRRRQRGGTRENEASRAGLRPEGVYVYAERSQGRANRPFLAGEHRCGEASRTLEGKPAQHRKLSSPTAPRENHFATKQGLPLRKLGLRCSSGNCRAPSSGCRRSTRRRRRPCACPSKSTPSTSFLSHEAQRP